MHLNERIAILDRLIDSVPLTSYERFGYRAERLGYDCQTIGIPCDPAMFTELRVQRRYEMGYADAQASSQWGEGLTLSPIEVGMLKATLG